MRTTFTSVIRSRTFRMNLWVWAGAFALAALLALAGGLLWLSGRHVVKTAKGTVVVAKRFMGFRDTWVDVRQWTWDDAVANLEVSRALIGAGYEDLLPSPPPEPGALEKAGEKIKEIKDAAVSKSAESWRKLKGKVKEMRERDGPPGGQAGESD
jgi:hypothetical protein